MIHYVFSNDNGLCLQGPLKAFLYLFHLLLEQPCEGYSIILFDGEAAGVVESLSDLGIKGPGLDLVVHGGDGVP